MVTASVIIGRSESGKMVFTPLPPPMLKLMVSAPEVLLAAVIAPRSEQSLSSAGAQSSAVGVVERSGSSLLSTVKVSAAWAGLVADCRPNKSASTIAAAKAKAVALPIRFVRKKKRLVLIVLFLS